VFNARSDEQSAFRGLRANRWLWASVLLSLGLQLAVVYLPFLQLAFNTVALSGSDWLRCAAVGSSVIVLRELSKLVTRVRDARGEQEEKRALQRPERRVAH
jgi:Ca2+-transporting ATPase